jgi:hypothetical protein
MIVVLGEYPRYLSILNMTGPGFKPRQGPKYAAGSVRQLFLLLVANVERFWDAVGYI